MKRFPRSFVFLGPPLFLFGAILGQQPTIEQRVERLERNVERLSTFHGLDFKPPVPLAPSAGGNIHLRFGDPGGTGTVLSKSHFVISHRNDWKIPQWVAYHLSRENLQGTAQRTDDFRPDPELPVGQRAELSDYRNSGFDRGHMAEAASFKRSQTAMSETFLLSNMAPQKSALNRRIWADLEDQVRSLARSHGRIWVFTGNIFQDAQGAPTEPVKRIGGNRVAVPTHCYKVILCEHSDGTHEVFAFILPNQAAPINGGPQKFLQTVDRVEKLTGLDFFAVLPDEEEDRLERTPAMNWPIP